MAKGRLAAKLILAAIPVTAAGLALWFLHAAPTADGPQLLLDGAVLAAAVLVLCVMVLWLLYGYIRRHPRARRLGRERQLLSERAEFLEGRLAILQDDVDVLSAMRELTRAAASNRIEDILDETLSIVGDLARANWVTIFIHDRKTGRLVPTAHRRGGRTSHGEDIPPEYVEDANVEEAFRYETLMKTVRADLLQAAIPAVSGDYKCGVIVVNAPLDGSLEARRRRIELCGSGLRDIAEHLAYALHTANLQVRAFEDGLTGLGSRGLFDERLDELVALSLRKNQALSLILLDIDNFKNVNDTHGHPLGDHVLRDVAAVLKQSLRRYDSAYRYGGEELAVLLPQTRLNNAVVLAERVREALEAREFSSRKIHVTASFGAATLGGETLSPMSLVALADRELYRAKALGRNRVEPASRLGLNRSS